MNLAVLGDSLLEVQHGRRTIVWSISGSVPECATVAQISQYLFTQHPFTSPFIL